MTKQKALASRRVTVGSVGLLAMYILAGDTSFGLNVKHLQVVAWPFAFIVVALIAAVTVTDVMGKK